MGWAVKASVSTFLTRMGAEPTNPGDNLPTPSLTPPSLELVAVGAVGAPVGVRGEVSVVLWTDDPTARFTAGSQLLTEPADRGPLRVVSARQQGNRMVVEFAGIADRVQAQALRRTLLLVPAAQRPALTDPDEFYDTDLIGLRALGPSGAVLGEVVAVQHGVGGDRLVITCNGRDQLVPFVAAIVPRVDIAAGVVELNPPEGLFEL